MKPYNLLSEYNPSPHISFGLYERDGVKYYQVNTTPVTNDKEINCEYELAQMMARPFRPARQPKVLILGLGVGSFLNAVGESLPQKKASFDILDLNEKAFQWYKQYLQKDETIAEKSEFSCSKAVDYLKSRNDTYHAIFLDPELWRSSGSEEDITNKLYLNYFVSCLKRGGLLGIITERPDKILKARMQRCGLEVSFERVSAVPGGKRQRTLWLAKKGHYVK